MQDKKKKLVEYNQGYILNAAKKLFQKNGVSRTTVDEIAREADCSKATIYVYFNNKDDIYYHIVSEYMGTLRDSLKECFTDNTDFEKSYFDFCNIIVQFDREYPMYSECLLGNICIECKKMQELPILQNIFDVGEEINTLACDFIIKGQEKGYVNADVKPLDAAFVMWSSICGLISLNSDKHEYLEQRLQTSSEEFLRNGFAMILNMIRK